MQPRFNASFGFHHHYLSSLFYAHHLRLSYISFHHPNVYNVDLWKLAWNAHITCYSFASFPQCLSHAGRCCSRKQVSCYQGNTFSEAQAQRDCRQWRQLWVHCLYRPLWWHHPVAMHCHSLGSGLGLSPHTPHHDLTLICTHKMPEYIFSTGLHAWRMYWYLAYTEKKREKKNTSHTEYSRLLFRNTILPLSNKDFEIVFWIPLL